jgi:methylglutaconyl-CoA hydratase
LIEFSQDAGIARITLNRPEKRNALNDELMSALLGALERTAADESVRVVLISGAGVDFCAGMDIALLAQSANAGVMEHLEMAQRLARVYLAMRKHPRPLVAAVQGRALGGGAGIATACDLVLAQESAQFGYPEVKIGFMPAIVMALLRRSVGEKRAFELLAMGDSFSAARAQEFGVINHVYPDAEFDSEVEKFVATLASRPGTAVSLTKRLLYHIDSMSFEAAVEAGIEANALSRMTEDAQRGFERFTKKQ